MRRHQRRLLPQGKACLTACTSTAAGLHLSARHSCVRSELKNATGVIDGEMSHGNLQRPVFSAAVMLSVSSVLGSAMSKMVPHVWCDVPHGCGLAVLQPSTMRGVGQPSLRCSLHRVAMCPNNKQTRPGCRVGCFQRDPDNLQSDVVRPGRCLLHQHHLRGRPGRLSRPAAVFCI